MAYNYEEKEDNSLILSEEISPAWFLDIFEAQWNSHWKKISINTSIFKGTD